MVDKTTTGDSQSSLEQWMKESNESRWKDVTKVFREAGLVFLKQRLRLRVIYIIEVGDWFPSSKIRSRDFAPWILHPMGA